MGRVAAARLGTGSKWVVVLALLGIIAWQASAQTGQGENSYDLPVERTVQFAAASYTVNEDAGTVTVTVTLSSASDQQITVDYATGDGSATATGGGADYGATSGTLTFAPGETTKDLPPIPINNDGVWEGDESFAVTLSNPTNVLLGTPATATVSILDDELPPPTVQFGEAGYSVNEDEGGVLVAVTLSGPSSSVVTVEYASSDGSATSGGESPDYVAVPSGSTLTFNPGETSQTFIVPIEWNGEAEPEETFSLTLSNPTNATLGSPDVTTVTIVDKGVTVSVTADHGEPDPASPSEAEQAVTISLTATGSIDGPPSALANITGPTWVRPGSGSPGTAWTIEVLYSETDPGATSTAPAGSFDYSVTQPGVPGSPDATLTFTPHVPGYWSIIARPFASWTDGVVTWAAEGITVITLVSLQAGGPALKIEGMPDNASALKNVYVEQADTVEVLKSWKVRLTASGAGAIDRWEYKRVGTATWTAWSGSNNPHEYYELPGEWEIRYVRGGTPSDIRRLNCAEIEVPAGDAGFKIQAGGEYRKLGQFYILPRPE